MLDSLLAIHKRVNTTYCYMLSHTFFSMLHNYFESNFNSKLRIRPPPLFALDLKLYFLQTQRVKGY